MTVFAVYVSFIVEADTEEEAQDIIDQQVEPLYPDNVWVEAIYEP